ncbi:hypothetical protein JTB14_036815 [Gonioctena quinquepunctata]|nr:hypothetical protein JTB14_036815 [Gonioctena quinquepunctata]
MYTGDTQQYSSVKLNEISDSVSVINHELNRFVDISKKHALHINIAKCSVIIWGRYGTRSRVVGLGIEIGDAELPVVNQVKNLGVTIDDELKFKKHTSLLIQKEYLEMKVLYPHRYALGTKTELLSCNTLILSTLNHCDVVDHHFLKFEIFFGN